MLIALPPLGQLAASRSQCVMYLLDLTKDMDRLLVLHTLPGNAAVRSICNTSLTIHKTKEKRHFVLIVCLKCFNCLYLTNMWVTFS